MLLSEPLQEHRLKEKLRRANRKNPCPICKKSGCGFNNRVALCWRVSTGSKERTKAGSFLHILEGTNFPIYLPVAKPSPKSDNVSEIYDLLLGELGLSKKHFQHLYEKRKLSKETILRNKYRSVPTELEGRLICQKLGKNYNLDYVPGFYFDQVRQLNVKGSGIFIPYRNAKGKIQGMQIRSDFGAARYLWFSSNDLDKGVSSGSPIHYVNTEQAKTQRQIYLTEGALKADCIAEYINVGVLAIAGVTSVNYEKLKIDLKKSLPEVTSVVLAFDADWKINKQVKYALSELYKTMSQDFKVLLEDWPISEGKGLDDYLLNAKNK